MTWADQLGPIGKGGFHLDVRDHLGHAVHDIVTGEHRSALAHEMCHGLAVASTFHHGGADERNRLRVVELQATGATAFSQQRRGEDQQLVFFTRGEFHFGA